VFEKLNINQKIGKEEYEGSLKELISDLVTLQYKFKNHKGPLIIIISGFFGSDVEGLVNFISHYIDMRQVKVATFWKNTFDKERPYYYKFWDSLPVRGKTTIFLDAYYIDFIKAFVKGEIKEVEFENYLFEAEEFEKMLSKDNAVIIKFWLYIDKEKQKKVIKKTKKRLNLLNDDFLESAKWHYDNYEKIYETAEKAIMLTDGAANRWHLIEAHNERFMKLKALKIIHEVYKIYASDVIIKEPDKDVYIDGSSPVLSSIDLSKKLKKDEYEEELEHYQIKIYEATWAAFKKGVSSVIIFEGFDAAGKGGCIRRLTNAIDTRLFHIHQIAAPTDYERQFHYLWRFWRRLPLKGFISLFDRSWYGRVLVERVEGFASSDEWLRAYEEINNFEQQLLYDNMIILKFWLHISADEQLRRFKERESLPWKQYKITQEDWRNRGKWDDYEKAANEMLTRTSTKDASWITLPANDKNYARIEVLKHFYKALKEGFI
jgi:polyphosphate:AMP phosphotransferase